MAKNKYSNKRSAPAKTAETAPGVQPEKKFTKKQKTIVICLVVVIALALVAGVVVVSLYATGAFEKEGATLHSRDVDNGFKKYFVTGGTYPGTYAVMTLNDGEKDYVIEILLMPEYAPKTVNNFIQYAEEGFYEGTVIHRIVPDTYTFQGGGYTYADGKYSKKTATHDAIVGEIKNNTSGNYEKNTISHFAGSISMARQGANASSSKQTKDAAYNSATSEFFLSWKNYPSWDGDYAAFGFIVDSEDVQAIKTLGETTEIDESGYPLSALTITKVEIKVVPEN